MMRTLFGLLLCSFATFCQEPAAPAPVKVPSEKAPAEVDSALRARVKQFYQAHVDGKYRVADQVVAEESKDVFFAAAKPRYKAYSIVKIEFSEDFSKADVLVACDADWSIRGEVMPVKIPVSSSWKVADGQWFWYVAPVKEVKTPFGMMNFNAAGSAPSTPKRAIPGDPAALARQILDAVRLDKAEIQLSSYDNASAEVRVTNGLQGIVNVRADLDGVFPGVTWKFDRTQIQPGEVGILTVSCTPKDKAPKPTLTLRIFVEPTGQVLPVKITFAVPPEIQSVIDQSLGKKPAEKR